MKKKEKSKIFLFINFLNHSKFLRIIIAVNSVKKKIHCKNIIYVKHALIKYYVKIVSKYIIKMMI